MDDLIAKLKNAPEGSREFDAEVHVTVINSIRKRTADENRGEDLRYLKIPTPHDECEAGTFWYVSRSGMSLHTAPAYTSRPYDLTAAMSLLPEGYAWQVRRNCSIDGEDVYCNAQVWPYRDPRDDETPTYWANKPEDQPALALTTAALKALRARQMEQTDG